MTIAERLADAGIEVKPLEWEEDPAGGFMAAGFNATYRIRASVSGSIVWQPGHMGPWNVVRGLGAAKAAAQGDYTARILSALQGKP